MIQIAREKIEGSIISKFGVSEVDAIDFRMLIGSIQYLYKSFHLYI